jgi:oxaloacetate decarboxylase alpha subunit
MDTGVDVKRLWEASELVDEHIGDEPVTPLAPRIAVRAAEHKVPPGLVASLDGHLRALGAGDRLDEVLDELAKIREEVGWPPIASPIGQIVGSQALLHVLSASRYQTVVDELRALIEGRYGSPPGPIDATVKRAVALSGGAPEQEAPVDLSALREEAKGLASSEEELLLLALFGDEAEPLLQAIRGRASGDESLSASGVDQARAERIRELVRIVQESGVGEVTIEEAGLRVSVRRTPEPLDARFAPLEAGDEEPDLRPPQPRLDGFTRVEAPMVGVFYRAPQPGAPAFVEEGDTVAQGQTLCILEAMKLMNEIKADAAGIVRVIHVGNAEPVEFGQLLFELEPVGPPPLDAL